MARPKVMAEKGLSLPPLFTDHMVLQREKPNKIWGVCDAGSPVELAMLNSSTTLFCIASITDQNGDWQFTLPCMPAGGPYQISISSGLHKVVIMGVLFGDVWLASGQSNMEWKIGWKIDNWQQEIADGDFPQIRYFEVENGYAASPLNHISGKGWRVASPETLENFSAVAWFFAKHYHLEKNVPVAIIDSTVGGTPAEAWTSCEALLSLSNYRDSAQDMLVNQQQWQQTFVENQRQETAKWQLVASQEAYRDGQILSPQFDDESWLTIQLPTDPKQPLSDITWLRKHICLDEVPKSASLDLGLVNQIGWVFINGVLAWKKDWQDITLPTAIDAGLFKAGNNIIVIRLLNGWDNKVELGLSEQFRLIIDDEIIDLSGKWRFSNTVEPLIPNVAKYTWLPGVLFNAMIYPLHRVSLTGVIWYQGENNVDQAKWYADLFQTLIADWRDHWQSPQLPFLFVQLAGSLKQNETPIESPWAELRDAQMQALNLTNTGMAVALDVGDQYDVHPRNKQDVGYRLWLAAKHVVFKESVVYSGPAMRLVETAVVEGQPGLLIHYHFVEQWFWIKGEKIKGFALAELNSPFHFAHARIIGQKVFVYHPKINNPQRVRYGWANFSDANLYNSQKLPAIPFQSSIEG